MHTEHALRFPGTPAGFRDAEAALRLILDARTLHPRLRHDIGLVFDEVVTNIVTHGRPAGEVDVQIRFDDETTLVFEDDGVAFDPRSQPAPPVATRREDLRIGGLGIVIVRELSTRMHYERTPAQRNRLTIVIPPVPADVDPTAEFPARR
jgi:anti-sigma regulatory factor (Ser/Thr protein kinase)